MPGSPMKPALMRQGHPRAAAKVVALPPALDGPPAAPKGLKRAGKDAWARLWQAGATWLSAEGDLGIVTRLCEAYDEREELRKIIKAEGRTARGSMGQLVTHPAVDQLRQLETLMTRYEQLCAMTPADRSRLGLSEVQRVSKLDEFLSRRQQSAAW